MASEAAQTQTEALVGSRPAHPMEPSCRAHKFCSKSLHSDGLLVNQCNERTGIQWS